MPTSGDVDRPADAVAVANRYHSLERPVSTLLAVLVVILFLGTFLATSLVPAVVVGALSVFLVRAPLVRSHGTVRLRTARDPQAVVDAFTGPTPPVLAFQWGIADAITTGDGTVSYRTAYLFGTRAVELTVEARTDTAPGGARRVELTLTANDRPWATYLATIEPTDGGTSVDVEYRSTRRFGLRRVPQQFVAERYRDDALTAQGYTVVDRDAHLGI